MPSNNKKIENVKNYIMGWYKQNNCDNKPNRDCYMLCADSNICAMFNEILNRLCTKSILCEDEKE